MESIIGMGICGVIVLAVYGSLTWAFGMLRMSQENLRVTQVLIEKIEICRLYTWEQISDPSFFPKNFTAGDNGEFKGRMSIRKGPNDVTYQDDMKTVSIEISWKSGHTRRNREFVTYVTRNGLQSYLY
jgi:hypothetical protein